MAPAVAHWRQPSRSFPLFQRFFIMSKQFPRTSRLTPAQSRRSFLGRVGASALAAGVAGATGLLGSVQAYAQKKDRTLRIGYQKGLFNILKARGTLEEKLAPLGVKVTWTEFTAGPVQLEALNAGAIDFGNVGDAPLIFAQAAGAPIAYVAASPARPHVEAVIVPAASSIQTVADLKGKKVAFNKGSNVHYFFVKLLQKHGLQYSDVTPVFLPPSDARAAFERGSVDAWVIWDPFLASIEKQLPTRTVADATDVVKNRGYYFSSQNYVRDNQDVLDVAIEELNAVESWASANKEDAAKELAAIFGIPLDVVQTYVNRLSFSVAPVTAEQIAEQQDIADTFYALKLIPKPIRVQDTVVR